MVCVKHYFHYIINGLIIVDIDPSFFNPLLQVVIFQRVCSGSFCQIAVLRIAKQCEVYGNLLYLRRLVQYCHIKCCFCNAVSYSNGLHSPKIFIVSCNRYLFYGWICDVSITPVSGKLCTCEI